MKPILFSTQMVQAIIEGRKTQTRRVIKTPPCEVHEHGDTVSVTKPRKFAYEYCRLHPYAPIEIGDILWVRETWANTCALSPKLWAYKADNIPGANLIIDWKSPLFMPKAAARIFLRATDVRVERLQDISPYDACCEGVLVEVPSHLVDGNDFPDGFDEWNKPRQRHWIVTQARADYIAQRVLMERLVNKYKDLWDSLYAKPKPVYAKIDGKKTITHYESYPWEDVQKVREYQGKKWFVHGNPWVWVYEFERTDLPC